MTRTLCEVCGGEIFRRVETIDEHLEATVTLECRCSEVIVTLRPDDIDPHDYPPGWPQ